VSPQTVPYDVIVIGAGPAGSAAATVLAQHGHRVALLEKQKFPRYRIGESLIPYCWFPLERLGLADRMESSGFVVPKHSVQFISMDGQRSKPFYFFEHYDHPSSTTWQVVRSDFDQLLLDNAVDSGVELFERTTAKELLRSESAVTGVVAERADGERLELIAPLTFDASGRDLFAATRNHWRVSDEKLQKISLWTYYRGALRDAGLDAGATTIAYLPEKAWFWYLPLSGDEVSVGIVADPQYLFREGKDQAAIFAREVALQPWISEHLAPGEQRGAFRVTRDFSYRSRYCASDGLVLVGDAFSFLDPVFSSGVFFALQGGVLAGDAAHEALAAGDVSAARFADYGRQMCRAMEAMRGLVHAFYEVDFSFGDFFKLHPDRRSDVTDVLIGALDKDFEPLFTALREFADIPPPLSHGGPLDG